ncbi:hypothetical protein ACHAWX_004434 [Stephanocyclus meneghinianus]
MTNTDKPNQLHPLKEEELSPSLHSCSINNYLESAYLLSWQERSSSNHFSYDGMMEILRYFPCFGNCQFGKFRQDGMYKFPAFMEILQNGAPDENGQVDFAGRGVAIAGAHFAGMLFSGLLSGVLVDVRGRQYTLLLGLVCNAFVGVASALARNATQLYLLRFTCGLGQGMVISGKVTLSAEISLPSCQGQFMTLVASCYTLGFLYTAFWALIILWAGSGSRRLFMFVNAIPTICAAILVVMFVPESPCFFLSQGRLRESVDMANMIVKKIGGNGQDFLAVEELWWYLFQAKQTGVTSFCANQVLMDNEENLTRQVPTRRFV